MGVCASTNDQYAAINDRSSNERNGGNGNIGNLHMFVASPKSRVESDSDSDDEWTKNSEGEDPTHSGSVAAGGNGNGGLDAGNTEDIDQDTKLLQRITTSKNSGGILSLLPFEEFDWMLNMPNSPDNISTEAKFSRSSWLTPPPPPVEDSSQLAGVILSEDVDSDTVVPAGSAGSLDAAISAPRGNSSAIISAVRNGSTALISAVRLGSSATISAARNLSGATISATRSGSSAIISATRLGSSATISATRSGSSATISATRLGSSANISAARKGSGNNAGEFGNQPLHFINFNDFRLDFVNRKPRESLPSMPENSNILVDISAHPKFDRSRTLLIFISHHYMSEATGDLAAGESSQSKTSPRRTADNARNEKFRLIVNAVNLLWTMAKGMNDCYVWMDCCCLDQRDGSNPAEELQRIGGLQRVMSYCDCMLTPIVDKDHASWEYNRSQPNWLEDYRSKQFGINAGSGSLVQPSTDSYLQRAWCRLEIFYAAYLPAKKSADKVAEDARVARMSGGLATAVRHGLRAHFVYGTKEDVSGFGLVRLPPLPRSFVKDYSPLTGALSKTQDKEVIAQLWDKLPVHENTQAYEYYIGERNAQGQKHGRGIFTWEDGSTYNGGWKCDEHHGDDGVLTLANGDVLRGSWENGNVINYATLTNVYGDVYYGEINPKRLKHGTGRMTYSDGDIYEGCFRDGLRSHKGRMRYFDGDEFVGYFKNNKMNGFGTWTYSGGGGGYFSGYFQDDRRHGPGIFSSGEGSVFEGNYVHGRKHGVGKMTYRNDTVLEGTWSAGKMHGQVVYTLADGSRRLGYWENGEYVGTEPAAAVNVEETTRDRSRSRSNVTAPATPPH